MTKIFRVWDYNKSVWSKDYQEFCYNFVSPIPYISPYTDCARYLFEQFTGIKDIKGNMIFENDIVKTTKKHLNENCTPMIGIVKFDMGKFIAEGQGMAQDISLSSSDLEIIGNSHENGDLLNIEKINRKYN